MIALAKVCLILLAMLTLSGFVVMTAVIRRHDWEDDGGLALPLALDLLLLLDGVALAWQALA